MFVVALPGSLFSLHPFLFPVLPHSCWPWLCQDPFLELELVSSARSQLYHVMLAECQLIGVHDDLAWLWHH